MDCCREFEIIWKKFLTLCRAKLMEKSRQCTLTPSAAQMSIQDAMSAWFDPYDACGGWLKEVEREVPQIAERIYSALKEWSVENVPIKKGIPEAGVLGVTAGSAAIGAGIGVYALHLGSIGILLAAVVPAIVAYPTMKAWQRAEKEKIEKNLLNEYMEQLSLLKDEIIILNSMI